MRKLRLAEGWRQQDLVEQLGGSFARSTLANVESGREDPSGRLCSTITERLPAWAVELSPHMPARPTGQRRARPTGIPPLLGGPYFVESIRVVYVFRDSKSPEEIIEVRRVRATASAADGYGLKLSHTGRAGFRVEEEALWGGDLVDAEHHDGDDRTVYLRRMQFGRKLRRGQSHEFAVRSWVARDPEPCDEIQVAMTIPCGMVSIDAHFLGAHVPFNCWRYGPVADDTLVPTRFEDHDVVLNADGRRGSAAFVDPNPGAIHGIRWSW